MLKLRMIFLLFFLSLNIFAIDVAVTKSNINYKEKIDLSRISLKKIVNIKGLCIPISINSLQKKVYYAKRYLKKGTILCTKDLRVYKKESVIFNFGTIQIEEEGKVIFENKNYIKVKKRNGKVVKIYKDGRLQ